MDEDFICPQAWKWSTIYDALHRAWMEANNPDIPEPPHVSMPISSDASRKIRWEETVQWAEEYGFSQLIPVLHEDEEYFKARAY